MLVAHFHSWYMFINQADKDKFYQGYHPIFCVVYDVDTMLFRTASSTEQHFKFNTWEVYSQDKIKRGEDKFKLKYSEVYDRILKIIKNKEFMNFDENENIICNYNQEDL